MIRTPKHLSRFLEPRSFRLDKHAPTAWKTLTILGLALYGLIWFVPSQEVESTTLTAIPSKEAQILTKKATVEPVTTEEGVKSMIIRIAEEEGYKAPLFAVRVAKCESNLNPLAVGDSGKSRGLWQIHKPSHPTITDDQAFDPEWSTRWAMKKFSAGQARLWTCAKLLS